MAEAFGEGAVQDTDGRQWEYVGTDGQAHGPFGMCRRRVDQKGGGGSRFIFVARVDHSLATIQKHLKCQLMFF
jgi:hypothetical protein